MKVEVDDDARTEAPTPTTAVTTSRKGQPFHFGDCIGIGGPCPERHVPCVLLAERSRLNVVEGAAAADEEGGDVVVPAVQWHTFQTEADVVELVFVVRMGLEAPSRRCGDQHHGDHHETRRRREVVLVHKAHEELLGVVLHDLDVGRPCAQGRCELGSHLLAGNILPSALQPGHRTVGGEGGRLRLHLGRRRDDDYEAKTMGDSL